MVRIDGVAPRAPRSRWVGHPGLLVGVTFIYLAVMWGYLTVSSGRLNSMYHLTSLYTGQNKGYVSIDATVTSMPTNVCARLEGYEGVIISMLSPANVTTYLRRFNYIDTTRFSVVGFYGAGQSLPKAEGHEAHVVIDGDSSIAIAPVAVPDEYPPRDLEYQVMNLVSNCLARRQMSPSISSYPRFFLRVDYDAFVAPEYLDGLSLLYSKDANALLEMGYTAIGTPHEVGQLGFPEGVKFCIGGPTVAYGYQLLYDMHGKWEGCASSPVTRHSDTEVQRCIYLHKAVSCKQSIFKLRNIHPKDVSLRFRHASHRDSRDIAFFSADSKLASAHVVHPLKDDLEFESVREAHLFRLAPPTYSRQMIHNGHEPDDVCILNKFAQRQLSSCTGHWAGDACSDDLRRCKPGKPITLGGEEIAWPTVYMITTDSESSKESRTKTLARFTAVEGHGADGKMKKVLVIASEHDHNAELERVAAWVKHKYGVAMPDELLNSSDIDVVSHMVDRRQWKGPSAFDPGYVPRPGEVFHRAAFRKALALALDSREEYFIIVEDDVAPSKFFRKDLAVLMARGCGRYMTRYAGALMLGSSDWNTDDQWSIVDSAMEAEDSMCYDAHRRSLGSFAVLYNRDGAKLFLREMDKHANVPTDHVFYLLAMRGAFVSVAYPNLVVLDHWNKTSQIYQSKWQGSVQEEDPHEEMLTRIKRSRWDVDRYVWSV